MMIRTQSQRPCRDVQLVEAVLLNNPVSPFWPSYLCSNFFQKNLCLLFAAVGKK